MAGSAATCAMMAATSSSGCSSSALTAPRPMRSSRKLATSTVSGCRTCARQGRGKGFASGFYRPPRSGPCGPAEVAASTVSGCRSCAPQGKGYKLGFREATAQRPMRSSRSLATSTVFGCRTCAHTQKAGRADSPKGVQAVVDPLNMRISDVLWQLSTARDCNRRIDQICLVREQGCSK